MAPAVAAGDVDKALEGRRKAPPGDGDQTDLAENLGLGDDAGGDAGQDRQEFGHHGAAEPGQDHGLNPVLPLGGIADADVGRRVGDAEGVEMLGIFAVDAVEVILPVQLAQRHRLHCLEAMAGTEGDGVIFAIQQLLVETVGQVGQGDQGDVDFALHQQPDQLVAGSVAQVDLQRGYVGAQPLEQRNQPGRADGTHHPQPYRGVVDAAPRLRLQPRHLAGMNQRLDVRPHSPSEVGEVGEAALALEQGAAQFLLQLLDRLGQAGLGDAAGFGGAGEVEAVAKRQEITGLMDFHGGVPILMIRRRLCVSGRGARYSFWLSKP